MPMHSGRTLAFLGDAVWSLVVREYFVEHGHEKGKDLQKLTTSYVSAKAQASAYDYLHACNYFTSDEEEMFKRGRNANAGSVPHNTPVTTYRKSTGFEAMIGYLYLEHKQDRIIGIWDKVRTWKEENNGTIDIREERCETNSNESF